MIGSMMTDIISIMLVAIYGRAVYTLWASLMCQKSQFTEHAEYYGYAMSLYNLLSDVWFY